MHAPWACATHDSGVLKLGHVAADDPLPAWPLEPVILHMPSHMHAPWVATHDSGVLKLGHVAADDPLPAWPLEPVILHMSSTASHMHAPWAYASHDAVVLKVGHVAIAAHIISIWSPMGTGIGVGIGASSNSSKWHRAQLSHWLASMQTVQTCDTIPSAGTGPPVHI